jgi:MFS family permease
MSLLHERADGRSRRRPTRFSYGWVIVAASLVLLVGSFGVQLSFGVFLKPLIAEFGWTRAGASGAMSLAMGVSGLIGVLMGRLTDRFDVRAAIATAMVLGTACYILLATMDSLWQFYLYFGLGGGICIGSTYTPVSAIVSKWFQQRRALALGIALLGISVGQMVFSPVAARLIEDSGWRTTYVVLGIVIFSAGCRRFLCWAGNHRKRLHQISRTRRATDKQVAPTIRATATPPRPPRA